MTPKNGLLYINGSETPKYIQDDYPIPIPIPKFWSVDPRKFIQELHEDWWIDSFYRDADYNIPRERVKHIGKGFEDLSHADILIGVQEPNGINILDDPTFVQFHTVARELGISVYILDNNNLIKIFEPIKEDNIDEEN